MNTETRFDIHWFVRGTHMAQYGVTQMELDVIKSGILFDGGRIVSIHETLSES